MKRAILYIVICLVAVLTSAAQTQYRTSELKRLVTVLNLDVSMLPNGYSHTEANGLTLTTHLTGNTLDHIGIRLFNDELRAAANSPIFDFLERYFLQLKYPPQVKTAYNMIRDDQFRFLIGNMSVVSQLQLTDDFSYSNDNNRYLATWSRRGQTLLSVSFPVEYELISGENKIEAEENLLTDIRRASVTQMRDDALLSDSYINECFSNRLYFQRGSLVMSSRHPAETAANLMLSTNTRGRYDISITQISYGFQKKVFQVPLRQWISFCRNNGCQLYFGVEQVAANGTVDAVVLAVNEAENYNHVLTVSIPSETIARRQGVIEARLYPYVPTHNVLNMFANYRKSNPKTFVSR